jgi:hypothetical protein
MQPSHVPTFRLNPAAVSDVVWRDVFGDLDLERGTVAQRLASQWQACEATRPQMAYNTGSVSPSTGLALYGLALRLAPRTMFEIGTFIGKSAVALALGTESAGVADAVLHTCDGSNDFHLKHPGTTRIVGYPRKTSTQALAELPAGFAVDLFHFDGRVADADLPLIGKLMKPTSVIALDDFEGFEKGVANLSLLRSQPWLRGHILAYPPDRKLLAEFGLHSRCLTAILLPAAMFGFTPQ